MGPVVPVLVAVLVRVLVRVLVVMVVGVHVVGVEVGDPTSSEPQPQVLHISLHLD